MAVVFFSYSHRDETLRDELQIHLTPLQRDGLIESWHDRRIDAGDEIHGAIDENLERANIILLLVSPYFLASNYCYDIEMRRAMDRHQSGAGRVIPVILQPCDWQSAPFGTLMALPTDGRPIAKFPNPHDGFLQVVQGIRKIVQPVQPPARNAQVPSPVSQSMLSMPVSRSQIRSSNLLVKKTFTDHDVDKFLDEAFEYIASFFEGSLSELEKRNLEITTRFRRVDNSRFTAFIYRNGTSVSECAVFLGGLFGKGISYSAQAASTNSMNDKLSVVDDGTAMYLKSMGMSAMGGNGKSLSLEGAAERFWTILIQRIQM